MTDIALKDNDLVIQNGDFLIKESLLQDAMLILASAPGHWKRYPAIGVDLENKLNDELSFNDLKRAFKQHLKYDKKKLLDFRVENGKLKIEVEYK